MTKRLSRIAGNVIICTAGAVGVLGASVTLLGFGILLVQCVDRTIR